MAKRKEPRRNASPRLFVRSVAVTLLAAVILCTAVYAVAVAWTRTVNGSSNGIDSGEDVAIAPDGSLYTVGTITDIGELKNIWIRKFNSSGEKLWSRTVNGASNGLDQAFGAAVDDSGNLFAVGYITVGGEGVNIWVRKYSPSGKKLWTRTVNGSINAGDVANAAAVGGAGNLYAVGKIRNDHGSDIWIRKYNSSGSKVWTRTVNGPGNHNDEAHGVAIYGNSLYVVGSVTVSSGDEDIWIRKYSTAGGRIWSRTVDGAATQSEFVFDIDEAYGAVTDSLGNLYVVGQIYNDFENFDLWIRKYNSSGVKLWTRTVDGTFSWSDRAHDVAVDAENNIYVIGVVDQQIWIRSYTSAGAKRWTTRYAPSPENAYGHGIAVNTKNRVYVTGTVQKAPGDDDIWVRKYRP